MIRDERIDSGRAFDWGRTSADYGKYRDIYPAELYTRLRALGVAIAGQHVLDIGTGTGVLPRNMYAGDVRFTGTDISDGQIAQAKQLAADAQMDIAFQCVATEALAFPPASFDAITACQCFFYFQHEVVAPKLHQFLKPHGLFAIVYMAWLPREDAIAAASEKLVLQYNPNWAGAYEVRHLGALPVAYEPYFSTVHEEMFDTAIPFTRDSWGGRIRACRGIGASLSAEDVQRFDQEHQALLAKIAPEAFTIQHYCAIRLLRAK